MSKTIRNEKSESRLSRFLPKQRPLTQREREQMRERAFSALNARS